MKNDLVYIKHILEAAEKVVKYTDPLSENAFLIDEKTQEARDKLIHDYMGVEEKTVWDTAKDDIPPLVQKLNHIVEA